MCKSVPHTPQAPTLMSAACLGTCGQGTVRITGSAPGASKVATRIARMPHLKGAVLGAARLLISGGPPSLRRPREQFACRLMVGFPQWLVANATASLSPGHEGFVECALARRTLLDRQDGAAAVVVN